MDRPAVRFGCVWVALVMAVAAVQPAAAASPDLVKLGKLWQQRGCRALGPGGLSAARERDPAGWGRALGFSYGIGHIGDYGSCTKRKVPRRSSISAARLKTKIVGYRRCVQKQLDDHAVILDRLTPDDPQRMGYERGLVIGRAHMKALAEMQRDLRAKTVARAADKDQRGIEICPLPTSPGRQPT